MKDGRAFAFAGIWDEWRGDGVTILSCSIITTKPNQVVRPVHDRMPVILREEDYELWLDSEPSNHSLRSERLEPYPAQEMESYPVGTLVNNPHYDTAELIESV
jgi:putative SOS response-associated peptidase YedK